MNYFTATFHTSKILNSWLFYLWVYNGEALVHSSISGLETWKKLLYVHPGLPHLQLADSPEYGPEIRHRNTRYQEFEPVKKIPPDSHGAPKAHRHMKPYILIEDNMEGKSIAESFLFHPQLVWVTWTEGAVEAWEVNQTHPFHQ